MQTTPECSADERSTVTCEDSSYFTLSESDSSLPARFQGFYTQDSGTVTFTQANLADGGAIAGTATVVLQHQTRPESRVTLTVDFHARFPPRSARTRGDVLPRLVVCRRAPTGLFSRGWVDAHCRRVPPRMRHCAVHIRDDR